MTDEPVRNDLGQWWSKARSYRLETLQRVGQELARQMPWNTDRQNAAEYVIQMAVAWQAIEANYGAEEVGLGDTPEEVEKWERAFLAAGEGILQLALMIVEE